MPTYIGTISPDSLSSNLYDTLYGLDGDDHLISGYSGTTVLEGGNGNDQLAANFDFALSVDIDAYGGNGSDLVIGGRSSIADRIYGGNGDDMLLGAATGSPSTIGTAVAGVQSGVDYLDGGVGNDALFGFDGDDFLMGGLGDDGNSFQSTVTFGGALTVTLRAGLWGGEGNDYIDGGLGNDSLYGGTGDDILIGGTGADLLLGEDGNDWLYGGSENDSLWGGAGNDVSVGDDGIDIAVMGDGNDVSWGYAGNDYFYMGNGNDAIYGGDGVDVMLGEAGNDYFDGGNGTDYFFLGSGGNDTVFVAAGTGPKVVNDFEAGGVNDTFQFAGSNWSTLGDVLNHTTNMGNYSIIALSPSTVIWVIGVTPNQFTASDFTLIS